LLFESFLENYGQEDNWGINTLLVPQPKSWGPVSPGPYGCCAYVTLDFTHRSQTSTTLMISMVSVVTFLTAVSLRPCYTVLCVCDASMLLTPFKVSTTFTFLSVRRQPRPH